MFWLALASLALLSVLVLWQFAPPMPKNETDPLAGLSAAHNSTDVSANSQRMDLAVPVAPDPEITAELARLKNENQQLRQSLEVLRSRVEILSDKVDAIDGRFAEVTGSISRPAIKPAPVQSTSPPVNLMPEDLPAENPPLTRTEFGVELGAYSDLGEVSKAWRTFLAEQPGLLQDLNPLASIRDRAGKTELVLVAGPFGNAAEAAARCALIETAGLACLPAFYLGQTIAGR